MSWRRAGVRCSGQTSMSSSRCEAGRRWLLGATAMRENRSVDGRDFLRWHQDAMVRDLGAFVERESPSTDKWLLGQFADFLAGYASSAGGHAEIIPMREAGNHVRVGWG